MSNPRELRLNPLILLRWKPEANSIRYRLSPPRATLQAQHVPRPELPRLLPPRDIPPLVNVNGPILPILYQAFPIADDNDPDPVEIPDDAPRGERLIPWMGRVGLVGGSLVCVLFLLFTFSPDSVSAALNLYVIRWIKYVATDLVRRGYGPLMGYAGVAALSPRSASFIMRVFSRLPSFVLVRFPSRYLALLPPHVIERLPNSSIEILPVSTIEQLSATRISLLSPGTIARLSPATIFRISSPTIATLRLHFGNEMYLRFLQYRQMVDGLALRVDHFVPWIPVGSVTIVTRLVVSCACFSTPLIVCMLVYRFFTRR